MSSRLLVWRARLRFGVGLLLALFMLSACIGGTLVTSTHTIGALDGRLVPGVVEWGDETIDCTWLVDPSGRRVNVWFADWDPQFRPLRLVDSRGRIVAREGDWLRVTYNADGIGESLCAPGVPILADTVEVLESPPPS